MTPLEQLKRWDYILDNSPEYRPVLGDPRLGCVQFPLSREQEDQKTASVFGQVLWQPEQEFMKEALLSQCKAQEFLGRQYHCLDRNHALMYAHAAYLWELKAQTAVLKAYQYHWLECPKIHGFVCSLLNVPVSQMQVPYYRDVLRYHEERTQALWAIFCQHDERLHWHRLNLDMLQ